MVLWFFTELQGFRRVGRDQVFLADFAALGFAGRAGFTEPVFSVFSSASSTAIRAASASMRVSAASKSSRVTDPPAAAARSVREALITSTSARRLPRADAAPLAIWAKSVRRSDGAERLSVMVWSRASEKMKGATRRPVTDHMDNLVCLTHKEISSRTEATLYHRYITCPPEMPRSGDRRR